MINPIIIRGKLFGGQTPLICAPMVGKTKEELSDEAKMASEVLPDCVEWRADYFNDAENSAEMVCQIRRIIPHLPIIFTLRIEKEGGFKPISQETRLRIINEVICSGQIDIVDIELCNGQKFINSVLETAKSHGICTIISNHHFKDTPNKDTLLRILTDEQKAGADIVKLAAMPNNPADVLILLDTTNTFATFYATVPAITVSMDKLGVISRLGGGVFGSALTFGTLKQPSAPGQVSVGELKNAFKILYD